MIIQCIGFIPAFFFTTVRPTIRVRVRVRVRVRDFPLKMLPTSVFVDSSCSVTYSIGPAPLLRKDAEERGGRLFMIRPHYKILYPKTTKLVTDSDWSQGPKDSLP